MPGNTNFHFLSHKNVNKILKQSLFLPNRKVTRTENIVAPSPCITSSLSHQLFIILLYQHRVPSTFHSSEKVEYSQEKTCLFSAFSFQDDLSTLSDTKSFGDVLITLQSEDILPGYTIRTMKV